MKDVGIHVFALFSNLSLQLQIVVVPDTFTITPIEAANCALREFALREDPIVELEFTDSVLNYEIEKLKNQCLKHDLILSYHYQKV